MILDARQLSDGSTLSARLVIIGGGMAGIAIARDLRDAGVDILILESGGETPQRDIQALYEGKGVMRDPDGRTTDMTAYLPSSRIRAFGGSGHVWGGKCGRLDPTDFEARAWVPGSGWPFDRSHLDPYYDRASAHLELPSFRADLTAGNAARPKLVVGDGRDFETGQRFHSQVSGAHSKAKFDAYRNSVTNVARIQVCLHANVTQIRMTPDGRAVRELEIRTLDGKRHVARGYHYVLATGGMENARLLLLSNETAPNGVGNDRGLVGRHFSGHLNASADDGEKGATSGIAFAGLRQSFDLYTTNDINKVWGILNATPATQRRQRLLNTWIAFTPRWYQRTSAEAGGEALARALAPSIDAATPTSFVPFRIMSENPPDPASRLTLDPSSRDALGQPRLALDWRLGERQYDTMNRVVALLARGLGMTGTGRVRWPMPRERVINSLGPARHHIGTTRMHADRAHGVVDEHCRMHGVSNLHVAGSSVFPTSGICNPTLTIVALAVRLADRLRPELRRAG